MLKIIWLCLVCGHSVHTVIALLPRHAIHSADYGVARCLSVCPSVRPLVCPSHASILLKRLGLSSNCFSHHSSFSVSNGMAIIRRDPLKGSLNAEGMNKSRFSANISRYLENDTR